MFVCVRLQGSAGDVRCHAGPPNLCQQCESHLDLGFTRTAVATRGSELVTTLCAVCFQAEQQLQKKGKGQPGEMLEKAAEQLMSCFRVCASDKSVHTHTHFKQYCSTFL